MRRQKFKQVTIKCKYFEIRSIKCEARVKETAMQRMRWE